ncbi:MAG: hypothetical protein H6813_02395 [Phycisphaeraceae bacterium]|nr:hypothetical protein [Phycisphaeraceae bacterium]MCB9848832.1 hypothetical protein [Phycisphaeraceae bacterium]
MRHQTTRLALSVAIALGVIAPVSAQTGSQTTTPPMQEETIDDLLREIDLLRRRVETLEQQRKQQVEQVQQQPPDLQPPPTRPAPQEAGQTAPKAADLTFNDQQGGGALGQGNLYNPAITIFGDLGVSASTRGDNDAVNRFNLREFEFDARAAISPIADGVFIATFGEELNDTPSGLDVSTAVDVEEAYVSFHTLPYGLTAKVGKFRNAFGVVNTLHTHDQPQVTRPLASQAFLGPEGMSTIGASASWLVPNPWDQFFELTGELINADGGEESPILGGPDAQNPAYLAHLKWFRDVGDYGSLELGGSYLYAKTAPDNDFDANVFGIDATLKLPDPDAPNLRGFLWQSELYASRNDVFTDPGGFSNNSWGMYSFVQRQFDQSWYAGVRFDYTEFPNDELRGPGDRDWGVSPYITWYLSEFLRLRFEYQHHEFETGGSWDHEDNFYLQLTFVLGAHPPHPYWVNH